jgi:hypothetical protein
VPAFFRKCGFREAAREKFPMKVRLDCANCPKYSCCDEKTVALELSARRSRRPGRAATQPQAAFLAT